MPPAYPPRRPQKIRPGDCAAGLTSPRNAPDLKAKLKAGLAIQPLGFSVFEQHMDPHLLGTDTLTRANGDEVTVPLVVVRKMGVLGCSHKDMASILGVSIQTVSARFRGASTRFAEAYNAGVACGNRVILRSQLALAGLGNASMLIWLGKQRLGQRDFFIADDGKRNDDPNKPRVLRLRLFESALTPTARMITPPPSLIEPPAAASAERPPVEPAPARSNGNGNGNGNGHGDGQHNAGD